MGFVIGLVVVVAAFFWWRSRGSAAVQPHGDRSAQHGGDVGRSVEPCDAPDGCDAGGGGGDAGGGGDGGGGGGE
jgi:hypothetical protein